MFDALQCTSVEKSVLLRLFAAARVTEAVPWGEAETEAEHEFALLWGTRTPAEPWRVEVNTEVLVHLAAAADSAVSSPYAAGSDWAHQVRRDLVVVRRLTGSAGA